ncbi:MAG: tetratricopeptide repeat protein, partial [Nitrospiraceae bacterium]
MGLERAVLVRVLGAAVVSLTIAACVTTPRAEQSPPPIHESVPLVRVASTSDSRSSYHFMLGYQAEIGQDIERAIHEYQAALRTDPTSSFLKSRLAALYFTMGDSAMAVRYADEVADGTPQDNQVLTQIAGVYAGTGHAEKALPLLDRVIEQDPSKSESYFSKGLILLNLKRVEEAEQALQQGVKVGPDSPVGHYYLGRIGVETKRYDLAVNQFERAIALNSSFEPAYLALAGVHESQQDSTKAGAVYRRYLQTVNPRSREVRQHLIRLSIHSKEYQEALKELEAMLAEDPSDLDAQLRLSLVYGELKDYPKAIERLLTILEARPAELKIRDYLGFMLEESKEFDKAIEAYQLNLKLDPSYYESHLHLGVLLYRLKRFPETITHLSEASKL